MGSARHAQFLDLHADDDERDVILSHARNDSDCRQCLSCEVLSAALRLQCDELRPHRYWTHAQPTDWWTSLQQCLPPQLLAAVTSAGRSSTPIHGDGWSANPTATAASSMPPVARLPPPAAAGVRATASRSRTAASGAPAAASGAPAAAAGAPAAMINVDEARTALLAAHEQVAYLKMQLFAQLPSASDNSRANHLRTLGDRIGPPPPRSWTDEWAALTSESMNITGHMGEAKREQTMRKTQSPRAADTVTTQPIQMMTLIDQLAEADSFGKNGSTGWRFDWRSAHRAAMTHAQVETVDKWRSAFTGGIDATVRIGWPRERAETLHLLQFCKPALARALRENDRSFAAATYALCDAIFSQAEDRDLDEFLPPDLYCHLNGAFSLAQDDPVWLGIETPDVTGFCGVTCSSVISATCACARTRVKVRVTRAPLCLCNVRLSLLAPLTRRAHPSLTLTLAHRPPHTHTT